MAGTFQKVESDKLNIRKDIKLVYKRFFPYVKMHKFQYTMVVIGMVLSAVGSGGSAWVVQPLIDKVFNAKSELMLFAMPLALIGVFFIKGLGGYIQGYYMDYIRANTSRLVSQLMLKKILSFELDFFNRNRSGEVLARMGDINTAAMFATSHLISFTSVCLTTIAYGAVVVYQGSIVAIIALCIMPLSVIPIRIIARKLRKLANQSFDVGVDMGSRTLEILNNIEIIKASSGEKLEFNTYKERSDKLFRLSRKSTRVGLLTSPFMELFGAIGMALVIIVGGIEVLHNRMTTGEFFSLLTAMLLMYKPIKSINGSFAGIQPALVANERLSQIIDREPEIKDGNIELKAPIDSIKVQDVTLKYDDFTALKNINLEFARNSVTAVIGKSGSGKSSLMNLILRLYEPSSGKILINDIDIKDVTQVSLRANISIVTQRIFIFQGSIASNVAYGLEIDEERVIEALKKAQALDFVLQLDNGINTILDEFGTNLSGGQRQRIAIARAIYKNPDILILDEATSALDEQTEEALKNTLQEMCKDRILIIVAHRPSTIELASRVVQINEGEILNIFTQEQYQIERNKGRIRNEDIV
ncbi:ATP-binding cassette domain-containing protein [Helicobacter saguini]|uniref:ABC transporter ATP-binding protein n=1 Tax=Helicobacter saguini TaxID=1548018 RepID=A0A347VLV5_9HELI|nr:ABC transporter ATP-binding protein [Helicobacter saguini]MWV61715.1 ATP-binding cassette domain-containing protein [Helicobacter saguini]MWV67613.1 ATP-binding cassette domain-containing protein [Helicobacter saguini]MWV69964.1 ATP-binding cassette domain-containing protein [Helicobacter saguini]MWV72822.1 ATP-binding cassette domain-containing protein [Helicobacter saguini]TLD92366.1 ABC transporter ATP-binding protein [Helicobacter saguini]